MVQLADRVAQGIAIVIKLRDDALVLLAEFGADREVPVYVCAVQRRREGGSS